MENVYLKMLAGIQMELGQSLHKTIAHKLKTEYGDSDLHCFYEEFKKRANQGILTDLQEVISFVFTSMMFEEECDDLARALLADWDLNELMVPNLLVVLAILTRERIPPKEQSLSQLVQTTSHAATQDKWNYPEFSRSLSKLPAGFFSLFSAKKLTQGKPYYVICSHYPELFGSLVYAQGHAPFSTNSTTASSYFYNVRFFRDCLPESFVSGCSHTLKELEHFYLLERLFRLDMKQFLFRDGLWKYKPTDTLSMRTVANILFHSPLVLFRKPSIWQDGICAYDRRDPEYTAFQRTVFIYLMLKVETYLFPTCIQMLYGKLCQYQPQGVLSQLEESARKLGLLHQNWLLPCTEASITNQEKTSYAKQMAYFSTPGEINLSRCAIRGETDVLNSFDPQDEPKSKQIYHTALDWL